MAQVFIWSFEARPRDARNTRQRPSVRWQTQAARPRAGPHAPRWRRTPAHRPSAGGPAWSSSTPTLNAPHEQPRTPNPASRRGARAGRHWDGHQRRVHAAGRWPGGVTCAAGLCLSVRQHRCRDPSTPHRHTASPHISKVEHETNRSARPSARRAAPGAPADRQPGRCGHPCRRSLGSPDRTQPALLRDWRATHAHRVDSRHGADQVGRRRHQPRAGSA